MIATTNQMTPRPQSAIDTDHQTRGRPAALRSHIRAATLLAITFIHPPAHAEPPFVCPRTGGTLVFALEAAPATLDPMITAAAPTRDIAMNLFESLVTRDEDNQPILDLAEALEESPDHLTFDFTLRADIVFHNGKTMTAADVAASFARYARIGGQRALLDIVASWSTPNPRHFLLHLKTPQPMFIEALSSFLVPIVIMPAEDSAIPANKMTNPVGTGPFRLAKPNPDLAADVTLTRHDAYQPNHAFAQRTGFGGHKRACLDTVTFRAVTDAAARAVGLADAELDGVEDLSRKAQTALKDDPGVIVIPVPEWSIQLAIPNTSAAPTDNLDFRRAVQAALDMDDIMDAAASGNYSLNAGLRYPGDPTDAGQDTYNLHDPPLARHLLAAAGYGGEPVILLTNLDYPPMYNAAIAVQQQLQALGVNAQVKVVDWPTSLAMASIPDARWNLFFTARNIRPMPGPLETMRFLTGPTAEYRPRGGTNDPDLQEAWRVLTAATTSEARRLAFLQMRAITQTRVYALPFGAFTKVQAIRSRVKGFVPFRIPRMANVWVTE